MHAMIGGAASSIKGVKHKNAIAREKDHMEKLGRPNRLLLNPAGSGSPQAVHGTPGAASLDNPRTPSRSGSFDAVVAQAGKWAPGATGAQSYGDECCDGKCSLLHFVVVFILAGVTTLIVGAVQYKEEAELFRYRELIVTVGCAILAIGCLLFFLKCFCFCRPRAAADPEAGPREKAPSEPLPPAVPGEPGDQELVALPSPPLLGGWAGREDHEGVRLLDHHQLRNSEKIVQAEVEIVKVDF